MAPKRDLRPRKRVRLCSLSGSLAGVWAVAVGEDRLRKHEVRGADVRALLEEIMDASVSQPLRVSSLLVVGVAKLVARKLEYLEAEVVELLARTRARHAPRIAAVSAQAVTLSIADLAPDPGPGWALELPELSGPDLPMADLPAWDLPMADRPLPVRPAHVASEVDITLPEAELSWVKLEPRSDEEREAFGELSIEHFREGSTGPQTPGRSLELDFPDFLDLEPQDPGPDMMPLADLELALSPEKNPPKERRKRIRKPRAPGETPRKRVRKPKAVVEPDESMEEPKEPMEDASLAANSPALDWDPGASFADSPPDLEQYRGLSASPGLCDLTADTPDDALRPQLDGVAATERTRALLLGPTRLFDLPTDARGPRACRAEQFAHLLALGARGVVRLEQDRPWSDVQITPGPHW